MRFSIRNKLMGTVATGVAIAFALCGIFASYYFFRVLKGQVVSDEAQKLNQTTRQLRYIQDEVESLAKAIAVDPAIQSCLTQETGADVFDTLANRLEISDMLSLRLNMKSYFYSAYLISSKGVVYSSNRTQGDFDLSAESWYESFKATGRQSGFTSAHNIYVTQRSSTREVISYIISIRDLISGRQSIGDIVINVDFGQITKNAAVDMSLLNGYALFDGNGEAILKEGELSLAELGYTLPAQLQNSIITQDGDILMIDRNMNDGWYLVSEVSNNLLRDKLQFVLVFFAVMYLLAMILLLSLLYPIILGIIRPVKELADISEEVGRGNFECRANITTNDELSDLGDRFNSMIYDLKLYVDRSIEHEKTMREMEINRLMLQINPHFIYNTLNSIVYMAQIGGNSDIVRFSQSFISLLQDTLNVSNDNVFTSLEQEIKNIRNYLVLQSYRYPGRFNEVYDIAPETLLCKVPSVLIQPLVENAVFHGICSKPQSGTIKIGAKRLENELIITVEDDGVGMSEDKTSKLLSSDGRISGMMRTIGVSNVKKRIETIYGNGYALKISSRLGDGTTITVNIPFEQI